MIYLGNSGEEVIRLTDNIIPDINEIQQDTIIDSDINDPREYNDDVYVNNIMIQKNAIFLMMNLSKFLLLLL